MSWAQGLRDIATEKNPDGSWVYPQVRMDLIQLKDGHAEEMLDMERKFIYADTRGDSLEVSLLICEGIKERSFLDSFDIGIIAGAALTILVMWGVGQTK